MLVRAKWRAVCENYYDNKAELYHRVFYNITSELAGGGAVGVPVGEAGEAGVCAITALQASRVAVWAARAGVEPVAVGVERRFDEVVIDRHLPASSNSAAGIPRCALHSNKLHIARIVAVPKERMAILVEEVGSGLGIVWIVIKPCGLGSANENDCLSEK